MKNKKVIIFGTGEIARLAKFYFDKDSFCEVIGFTADDQYVSQNEFDGLPLIPFSKVEDIFSPKEVEMHVALSYRGLNRIRGQKYYEAKQKGYKLFSYICSKSVFWDDLSIGENCFILENQTIQPTVKIGNNVMIWSGNHIGHGAVIKDHCYISSHVVIAGHAVIGERSFLGVNSAVRDFVNIGDETFIAMGTFVSQDTKPGSVVLGEAGKIYEKDSKQARILKRKYFSLG